MKPQLNLKRIAYGADYNPEQWPEKTVSEDIELMKEAGVDMVSLGIFSWAKYEPTEGEYHFEWLLKIMDQLHEAGIMVDLATGTASPPIWLAKKYPETLPHNAAGVPLGFGSRQQYAPASPKFREKMRELVKALAQVVKDHPALKMWHVSNEFGCHVWESFDPHTISAFQNWLENKYKNIDTLNHAWATSFWSQTYGSFNDVSAPGLMPTFTNPAHLLDWKRFGSDMLIELLDVELEVLREVTPQIPVTTNFMEFYPQIDYWKMAKRLDVISDDCYPDPADPASPAREAFAGDLMRSLAGSRPYLLMEQTTAAVQWRPTGNSSKRPGQFKTWSLSRVARGANGILHFQWRQSPGGAEAMHSAMVPHSGRDSYIWKQVVDLGNILQRFTTDSGKETNFLNEVPTAQVAIVLDWDAVWAAQCSIGPVSFDPYKQLVSWYKTCYEAGYVVDFVESGADLSKYKLTIVPGQIATKPELLSSFESASKAGGTILVCAPFGIYDQTMRTVIGGYHGDFTTTTGVKVTDLCVATDSDYERWAEVDPKVDRISGAVVTPATEKVKIVVTDEHLFPACEEFEVEKVLEADKWAELVRPQEDVRVLATFASEGAACDIAGQPAITARPWNEGKVVYLATDLAAPGRAVLLRTISECAGLPQNNCLSAGVEVISRGEFTFVFNHGEETVPLPSGQKVYDLVSEGEVSTVSPRDCVIYRH
ncbi:beta-galactosidase [Actinomycetaceae bacterium TAE3-ERU4]|nr:beta-galactosidase [Actinomycetaceae bacterium TAE3-ERU4]